MKEHPEPHDSDDSEFSCEEEEGGIEEFSGDGDYGVDGEDFILSVDGKFPKQHQIRDVTIPSPTNLDLQPNRKWIR